MVINYYMEESIQYLQIFGNEIKAKFMQFEKMKGYMCTVIKIDLLGTIGNTSLMKRVFAITSVINNEIKANGSRIEPIIVKVIGGYMIMGESRNPKSLKMMNKQNC